MNESYEHDAISVILHYLSRHIIIFYPNLRTPQRFLYYTFSEHLLNAKHGIVSKKCLVQYIFDSRKSPLHGVLLTHLTRVYFSLPNYKAFIAITNISSTWHRSGIFRKIKTLENVHLCVTKIIIYTHRWTVIIVNWFDNIENSPPWNLFENK